MKNTDSNLVWYASYGSNICMDRFLCYIQGGIPQGSSKLHHGCTDKSLPEKTKNIVINRQLYFAKEYSSWGRGGVAFIKNEVTDEVITLGRMYLITYNQFIEVVKQENDYTGELVMVFRDAIDKGNAVFLNNAWYGNLVYLGEEQGLPIFTFTNQDDLNDEINPPAKEYLDTLKRGVKESYEISDSEIQDYFNNRIK